MFEERARDRRPNRGGHSDGEDPADSGRDRLDPRRLPAKLLAGQTAGKGAEWIRRSRRSAHHRQDTTKGTSVQALLILVFNVSFVVVVVVVFVVAVVVVVVVVVDCFYGC